jgi:hypothetical protein
MASGLLVYGRLGLDRGGLGCGLALLGQPNLLGQARRSRLGEKERSARLGGPVGPEGKGKKWVELENGVFQFMFF